MIPTELIELIKSIDRPFDPNMDCSEIAEFAINSLGDGELINIICVSNITKRLEQFKWYSRYNFIATYYYHVAVKIRYKERYYVVDLTAPQLIYEYEEYICSIVAVNVHTPTCNFMCKLGRTPQDLVYSTGVTKLTGFKPLLLKSIQSHMAKVKELKFD